MARAPQTEVVWTIWTEVDWTVWTAWTDDREILTLAQCPIIYIMFCFRGVLSVFVMYHNATVTSDYLDEAYSLWDVRNFMSYIYLS